MKKLLFIVCLISSMNVFALIGDGVESFPYIGKAISTTYNASALISGVIKDQQTANLTFYNYVFPTNEAVITTATLNIHYKPHDQGICAEGTEISHDGSCTSNLTVSNCRLTYYYGSQRALEGYYKTKTPSGCAKPDTGWVSVSY